MTETTDSIDKEFYTFIEQIEKIPTEQTKQFATENNCEVELAAISLLLSETFEFDVKIILDDLKAELARLKKNNQQIKFDKTTLNNFVIDESKWIIYLRGLLYNKLIEPIESIQAKIAKLDIVKGSDKISLATILLMERQYITADLVIPAINKWADTHPESTILDATTQIYASLIQSKNTVELLEDFEVAKTELLKQVETLGNVLSEAEQNNWIIRALIEVEMLYEDFSQPINEITEKGMSDIILWLLILKYNRAIGDYKVKKKITNQIEKLNLETVIGIPNATTQVKLEYHLLLLEHMKEGDKAKFAEEIILEAWNEYKNRKSVIDAGREILALLLDYSNLSPLFISKVPRHFEFIATYYKGDRIRLNRALERFNKNTNPIDEEKQEYVIIDYLIQFLMNYFVRKMKADPKDLEVPDEKPKMDISIAEKDIIDMIDAALRRGIRTQDQRKAVQIFESQLASMYRRLLNVLENELAVGETILYGLLNSHGRRISRDSAREIIMSHFRRMNVSLESSGKKRIDSVIQKSICLEVEEKIIKRDIK